MPRKGNVYVIDDDAAMRDSLDFLLDSEGFSVQAFESAQAFLDALPTDPGCILSDVRMPGIDGMALLKRLKELGCKLPVLIMTGHGDVPLAVEAMKLGAMDFIEKPFEDERLIGMIEAALRHAASGAKTEAVAQDIAARVESLSPRERQVMDGLIAGLSNKVIAREFDISPRTIEVYRANVMTKMQASSLSELVRLAMRAGAIKD
ncbi:MULTISPECIES: response regulator FixJ [Rhodopseudomonas]|uniref:Response regulator FixJ n=1 Tax=Rhodopseudomonas palustris TaxID=1076 RepID=A0A0D7EFJ2_RHOPL|nr:MULTISPECIES: response regulator FixJ [Rhodopseudomonas]KIZ39280.1 response regulator FixJ [Rhodopseudomonas palustris]MDF3813855.1 response regulator FixJ [Rhodopseudomonas sp. BAL398]WOK15446.1 response regulator FixJ [Rhodopseudomonas sp. BAL398]